MNNYITNINWKDIFHFFNTLAKTDKSGYTEVIGFSYLFDPVTDYAMSEYKELFDTKKAAKMFFWYQKADEFDDSIIGCFPEYEKCIDEKHKHFNSNYGKYAYTHGGLDFCIKELSKNSNSRRACFCINSNHVALDDNEIDKLCTNAIQFFIRNDRLEMVVQMRSSNFLTLLPYDVFMFSIFYYQVYLGLKKTYKSLMTDYIHMQVASLHYYESDLKALQAKEKSSPRKIRLIDFDKPFSNTINILHKELNK